MSELLESLLPPASRAACEANDVHQGAAAGQTVPAHTPLPWRVGREWGADQQRPSIEILREVQYAEGARPTVYRIAEVVYPTTTGNTVGAAERAANAALIVRAVNSHAAMVSEAATLRADLDEALLALRRLEVSGNSVVYCYRSRPENFAAAMRDWDDDADVARSILTKHKKD